jgi:hypothetical protein
MKEVSQKRPSVLKKAGRQPEQVWSAFPMPRIEQDSAVKWSHLWSRKGSEAAPKEFFNRLDRPYSVTYTARAVRCSLSSTEGRR